MNEAHSILSKGHNFFIFNKFQLIIKECIQNIRIRTRAKNDCLGKEKNTGRN